MEGYSIYISRNGIYALLSGAILIIRMKKAECDVGNVGTIDSSEKTIAILGEKLWPQMAHQQEGDKISKTCFFVIYGRIVTSPPSVGGVSIRSRNGAPSRKGCVLSGQTTKASYK